MVVFLNDTATTEIYTLSLHDALPISLRDALGSLVKGHLAGLFDDYTSIAVDWRAPIQSLSLSRLEPLGDQAVGIALTCLNSWGQAMREIADPGDLQIGRAHV